MNFITNDFPKAMIVVVVFYWPLGSKQISRSIYIHIKYATNQIGTSTWIISHDTMQFIHMDGWNNQCTWEAIYYVINGQCYFGVYFQNNS